MLKNPTMLYMNRHYKGLNPGEKAGFRDEAEIATLLKRGIARLAKPDTVQAVVDAGLLEQRAEPTTDDLDKLAWPDLMSRAKELADSRGESLDEAAGGRSKDAILAYVRKHQE